MATISLRKYVFFSIFMALISIFYAFSTHIQYYPAVVSLAKGKLSLVIFGNLAFMIIILFAFLIKKIFFGILTEEEVIYIYEKSRNAVIETCLALTLFREGLSINLLLIFTALLFNKIFHWIIHLRVENIGRFNIFPILEQIRLLGMLTILTIVDSLCVLLLGAQTLRNPSVILIFVFEFGILLIDALSSWMMYPILLYDAKMEGRWERRADFEFIAGIVCDSLVLISYMLFFGTILVNFVLPLHIIPEIYVAYAHWRTRITKYRAYRRLEANLNERFPNANAEEMKEAHMCVICREIYPGVDIDDVKDTTNPNPISTPASTINTPEIKAKKLVCGHILHFTCLRRLLQSSQECPSCRTTIADPVPPVAAAVDGDGAEDANRVEQQHLQQQQQMPPHHEPPPADVGHVNPSFLRRLADTFSSVRRQRQGIQQQQQEEQRSWRSSVYPRQPSTLPGVHPPLNSPSFNSILEVSHRQMTQLSHQIIALESYLSELRKDFDEHSHFIAIMEALAASVSEEALAATVSEDDKKEEVKIEDSEEALAATVSEDDKKEEVKIEDSSI